MSPSSSSLSDTARAKAELISQQWKGTSATGGNTKNFIGGEFVESKTSDWIDVVDPVRVSLASRKQPTDIPPGFSNIAHQSPRDYQR